MDQIVSVPYRSDVEHVHLGAFFFLGAIRHATHYIQLPVHAHEAAPRRDLGRVRVNGWEAVPRPAMEIVHLDRVFPQQENIGGLVIGVL